MTSSPPGRVLVVDDHPTVRLMLTLGLQQQGFSVTEASTGAEALGLLRREPFDVVLLDIVMPEMDGHEVLAQMKADAALRDVPVIVISAQDELESVVRAIELGAEDHLPKTFEPVLLRARINASLEKKRLRDAQRAFVRELELERERSERLLLNILPGPVAQRLKQGQSVVADSFDDVSVMFADIVSFMPLSTSQSPVQMVRLLNDVFSTFDALAEQHGLEKIKTIGDAYMAVGGLPSPRPGHLQAIAAMALDMVAAIPRFRRADGSSLQLRVGIHVGPVVAGVIGTKKFSYDLWGDTVNVASRMESHGLPGQVQVSQAVYERLKDTFAFESRGLVPIKGMEPTPTYLLRGHR
jgi:class 3 adenylate cyclase